MQNKISEENFNNMTLLYFIKKSYFEVPNILVLVYFKG